MTTRDDVKQLAYNLNPEAWVSYSGKTPKEKRWIDHLRTQALEEAAQRLGFTSYLEAPEYVETWPAPTVMPPV
jgi:hypothetical protein